MTETHVNTIKVAAMRLNTEGKLQLLLLLHKPRKNTPPQKNKNKKYREKLHWGFIGGHGNPGETFMETIEREGREETEAVDGTFIKLTEEMFDENFAVHGDILISERDDGSETYQNHFYPTILPTDTEVGEIRPENDEITEGEWFDFDRLPMPDDTVSFPQTQLFALKEMLRAMAIKWTAAVPYFETVDAQNDAYKARCEVSRSYRRS